MTRSAVDLVYLAAWMIALSLAVFSYTATAQEISDRAGKAEVNFQFSEVSKVDIDGSGGSHATLKSDPGAGMGFAYNLDNHWAFGVDFSGRRTDYTTTTAPAAGNAGSSFTSSGTIDTTTTSLTATYHFSPARFTPFITANAGRTWVDTNIPDGPPGVACWYDPWWGQYCGPAVPTKSDVYWSYGAGLGLRWDSRGPFFMRASVSEQWLDVGGSVGKPSFTNYRLDFGFRF